MIKYVIDIGSNSCRLMKAECAGKEVRAIYKKLITARTGEGVNETHLLTPAAIGRTCAAVKALYEYAKKEDEHAEVLCFATSATRDALNRAVLTEAIKNDMGITVDVISGEVEGRIGFLGAVGDRRGGLIDIGGCSTEIAYGENGVQSYVRSFDIGAVRAKDMFKEDAYSTIEYAQKLFCEAPAFEGEVYACGGTATTLAAMLQELKEYDPDKTHGYRLNADGVKGLFERTLPMSTEERRQLNGLQPERADIICHGMAILLGYFAASGRSGVVVSEADNLEGYLLYKSCEN